MPKLPVVSSDQVKKVLKNAGFQYAPKRGKGSHTAFVKKGKDKTRLVIIPERKNIPRGTLLSILDQSGLSKEDFFKFLR